mmetsp:Transcript_4834/g.11539  ORF Transcript_4834/g.11539 Transcript_4834/m.11539 type:complete len:354 (+) Transcript_4834:100-1161(+)
MEQVSQNQIHGVLQPIQNGIGIRERPKTMLSPEMKRKKTVSSDLPVVAYPASIPVPSKRVIQELYKASVEEGCEESNENNSDEKKHYNDQKHLAPAGVLSFQNILLPAIGLQEEKAVKQVQSKVQRDAPEYKFVMENCRRLVRQSIQSAMDEVQSSRSIRYRRQQILKEGQRAEAKLARELQERRRKEEQERLAEARAFKKETLRIEKRRNLARDHPRNQSLWKEIVFLTSSLSRLEQEFCMLVDVEVDMRRLDEDLEKRSDENTSSSSDAILVQAKKNPLQTETEEKTKEMILTSTRIQKGLEMILKLAAESETARKELYCKYKKDHVFRGYQSVKNPKSMIRFLSQSQDDI